MNNGKTWTDINFFFYGIEILKNSVIYLQGFHSTNFNFLHLYVVFNFFMV